MLAVPLFQRSPHSSAWLIVLLTILFTVNAELTPVIDILAPSIGSPSPRPETNQNDRASPVPYPGKPEPLPGTAQEPLPLPLTDYSMKIPEISLNTESGFVPG